MAGSRAAPVGLERGDGSARKVVDLQGANQTPGIILMDAPGGGRVDLLQPRYQLRAVEKAQFFSHGMVGGGAGEEAFEKRLVVEWSAAGGDERDASLRGIGDHRVGGFDETGDREGFTWVDQVEQVMANFGPLRGSGLGGSDFHSTIYLH